VPVSLDVNHRPQLVDDRGIRGIVDEVVGTVDTLLCNEDEARILTGTTQPESAIVELATRGPRVVVVKLGRHGALAHVDGTTLRTDAFEVPAPTFPVGAGDAFNAAWIAASLDGTSPEEALRMAAWAAACVVAHRTDHEGFPSDSAFRAARDRLRSGDLSAPGDDR